MSNPVTCPLCGSTDITLIADTVRFDNKADVYDCATCGLTFLDQASFTFPEDFYKADYHQTYITHVEPDAFDPKAYFEKMMKANRQWAEKFTADLKGDEVILDLGCSTGHFIEMVKDRAGKVYGHDLNVKEVEFCKTELGLDVADIPLDERFEEGTFDYITMIYVLEHIAEPREFLASVSRFLKPDGKFVILVPNAADALVNFYDIPEFRAFYYCIEHLFYYTPATLKRLFDECGLEGSIETIQEYPITNHLNWAYRRRPSDTLASRSGLPDVELRESAPADAWKALWEEFDGRYKQFLAENGYGDRVWAVVGRKG